MKRFPYKLKSLLVALICLPNALTAIADNGHNLWLNDSDRHTSPQVSITGKRNDSPTLRIAENELKRIGWEGATTFDTGKRDMPEGAYSIMRTGGGATTISASSPIGVLYAVYELDRMMRCQQDILNINVKESPAYRYRVLNHWDNPDGTIERGYAGFSIWKWDELPDVVSPRYEEYARACASVGINASVLNNVNAKPIILSDEYLSKIKVIADQFRPYGVKVFLSVNFASPKVLGGLATADPFDKEVKAWWKAKAKEIYSLIPDFGGFLVKANSEGEAGPCDYGRTHVDGANMLADALRPHGGIVMWRAFVYAPSSPDRVMQAYDEFKPFDGKFKDNVIIQVKNGPIDFQPREPFSPLFGSMPKTNLMVEFQITQEYLGASNHLCYLAPLFKETLDADTHRMPAKSTIKEITASNDRLSAIAGVANIGDDPNWCGHLFAQSNWYAFGRLAWNPDMKADKIAAEWLKLTLSADPAFVSPMTHLMMESREAVVNYMMPMGLHHIFARDHHYGPAPWFEMPDMRRDWTATYYHQADADGIGFDRTMATGSGATSQYAEPIRLMFENKATCPDKYLLWFHHVAWTDKTQNGLTLWEDICRHYDKGLQQARQFQIAWDKMRPYVDSEKFAHVGDKLKIQTHDAQWWKDACLLYFQSINHLPFPDDMERPVYDLDRLKKVDLPLKLHGCPTRDMLP